MPIFLHILIIFKKLILKCTSLLLKNTFKSPKFQKNFQKKIARIKCISFCTTAEEDEKKHCNIDDEINTVMAAYSYIQCYIIVAHFDYFYCTSVWSYTIPQTLLFLIWIYFCLTQYLKLCFF